MIKRVGRDRGRERDQDMMSSATSTTGQVKCTHFDEPTLSITTPSNKRLPPKTLAINIIKAKTGFLHPSFTTILQKLGACLINFHIKAYHKAAQKNGWWIMTTFTLMVPKEAEEDQEYKDLLEETNTAIRDCRKILKVQVLKCIDIKILQTLMKQYLRSYEHTKVTHYSTFIAMSKRV
eukprot:2674891-Ditylum_brightwellii.AAC.1